MQQRRLRGIQVRDRDPLERLIGDHDVDDAGIGERGHGQIGHPLQGALVVERGGQLRAGLRQKGQLAVRRLRRGAGRPLAGQEVGAVEGDRGLVDGHLEPHLFELGGEVRPARAGEHDPALVQEPRRQASDADGFTSRWCQHRNGHGGLIR